VRREVGTKLVRGEGRSCRARTAPYECTLSVRRQGGWARRTDQTPSPTEQGVLEVTVATAPQSVLAPEPLAGDTRWTALDTASTWLYLRAPRVVGSLLAFGDAMVGVSSGGAPTTSAAQKGLESIPRVTLNRLAGNAWRDELANVFRSRDYRVQTEVYK
jgi:hypothetical protein